MCDLQGPGAGLRKYKPVVSVEVGGGSAQRFGELNIYSEQTFSGFGIGDGAGDDGVSGRVYW